MSITAISFMTLVPEFATVVVDGNGNPDDNNAQFVLYKTIAESQVNATIWGTLRDTGIALLVAHYFKMLSERQGKGGEVTGATLGDGSTNYSTSKKDDELVSTSYGQEFLRIRNSLPIVPFAV